jgi:hypothetical protein
LVLAEAKAGWSFVLVIDEFQEMAGNPLFDSSFFSLLRALGDNPEYRLAWLTASRRPLETLCGDKSLNRSSFSNIFGTPWVLGLLRDREADDLVCLPTTYSLSHPVEPPLFRVKALTGNHPALIQLVMAAWWPAAEVGGTPDWRRIERGLGAYFRDVWTYCSDTEQACLLALAMEQDDEQGGVRHSDALLDDLHLRGLVAEDARLFSAAFSRFVLEQVGPSITPPRPATRE